MTKSSRAIALVAALIVWASIGTAEAQGVFKITIQGTWTVPAADDSRAVEAVQAQLSARFASIAYTLAFAVRSPVQLVPGATTWDTTVEAVIEANALTLSDSLSKISFQSLGTAILKAGKLKGTREKEPGE